MATDPNLLMHLVNAPGLAAQAVFAGANQALGQQQARQDLRIGEQNLDINRFKLAAAQQQQAQAQQYQADVAAYLADPSPAALSALMSRYTDQADALKKAWDVKDGAVRAADMAQFGAIYSALDNGKVDLAINQLRARRDAEKAQGIDTSDIDQYLEALQSGDEAAIKAVKGFALAQIAAGDRDKYSEIFKTVGGERGTKVVGPGAALIDAEGNELYKAPFAPRPVTVGEGDTVVEYQPGGGDPASGGGGSGRYTGGWTPRARNGGDNDDAAVDNKIAGAARALGIGPDESLSGKSPMDIAKAMTLSEGGAGSLADRNNNPANMKNADGSFKKFASKEEGLRAAAALVARKMKAGQTTVRSMIEGLPVEGQSGGPRVIAQGGAKSQYRMLTAAEKQAQGLDQNIQYQMSPNGQITPLGGQNRQVKQIPQPVADKVQPHIDARDTLRMAVPSFKNEYGGHWLLGDRANDLQALAGTGPKGMRDWWSKIYSMDNVVRNQLFGSALTATEQAAWERTTVKPSMQPAAIKSNLNERQRILEASLARRERFLKANGYDPDAVNVLFSPLGGHSSDAAPVRVRTIQQAQKLAPGTVYIAPDGKVRRR